MPANVLTAHEPYKKTIIICILQYQEIESRRVYKVFLRSYNETLNRETVIHEPLFVTVLFTVVNLGRGSCQMHDGIKIKNIASLVQDSKFITKASIILLPYNLEYRYITFILLFLIDGPLCCLLFSS